LALRRPDLLRSLVLQSTWPVMDPYLRTWLRFVRWLVEFAPSERVQAGNEGPAAIPGRLPRPRHGRSAAPDHRADAGAGRRARPSARPELGRAVADAIPGALFEIMEEESHQPFQEVPDQWNARVAVFWQEVDAGAVAPPRPREALEAERPSADRSAF
jgi:pimeloyl-ACP methyl ester carboxylesterase